MKLSKVSKLDGIKSWSLQARETCPGSLDANGELVPACSGCYAVGGNYRFKNVRAPREFNRTDWKRDGWVADMVEALAKETHFRWFDSGDVYHPNLARKILEIVQATPHVKHWLPTRSHKLARIAPILEQIAAEPNAMVRHSSDSVLGDFIEGVHGSTILPTAEVPAGVHACKAYENAGKCNGCRACWDKEIPVIGYAAHGQTMTRKVIPIALAS